MIDRTLCKLLRNLTHIFRFIRYNNSDTQCEAKNRNAKTNPIEYFESDDYMSPDFGKHLWLSELCGEIQSTNSTNILNFVLDLRRNNLIFLTIKCIQLMSFNV